MKQSTLALCTALVLGAASGCIPIVFLPAPPPPEEPSEIVLDEHASLRAHILELVNAERRRGGLEPVRWHPDLDLAASVHAANMADRRHLAHTLAGIEQHSLTMRAIHAGYEFTRITENLASGYQRAEDVVAGWMASPGHRANILDAGVKESGVGVKRAADGIIYFCQVFAVQHPYAGR